jgi:hypothetical protein
VVVVMGVEGAPLCWSGAKSEVCALGVLYSHKEREGQQEEEERGRHSSSLVGRVDITLFNMSAPPSFCGACRQSFDSLVHDIDAIRCYYDNDFARYDDAIVTVALSTIARLEREREAIVCTHVEPAERTSDDSKTITGAFCEQCLEWVQYADGVIEALRLSRDIALNDNDTYSISVFTSSLMDVQRVKNTQRCTHLPSMILTAPAAGGGTMEVRLEPFVPPPPQEQEDAGEVKK